MASYEIRKRMYINDSARIDGKVVIVTGCNTGIGKATAHELAKRGGKIYMASRNEEATMAALKEIKESTKNDQIYFLKLDLASLESVNEFCRKFRELENRLDILINNAGLLCPLNRTADGFEMSFGVNHLGHFLLTNLLLDLIKASAPSRIVVMSSSSHEVGRIDRDNINSEKHFPGIHAAYANSKLANVLFMKELAKRLEGTGVVCNALGPGRIHTEAFRYLHPALKFFIRPSLKYIASTPKVGCQTSVMLAVEPSLAEVTGCYYDKCIRIEPTIKGPEDDQLWLWEKSEELTKLNG